MIEKKTFLVFTAILLAIPTLVLASRYRSVKILVREVLPIDRSFDYASEGETIH